MRQTYSRAQGQCNNATNLLFLGQCNNTTNLLQSSGAMRQRDKLTIELGGQATNLLQSSEVRQTIYSRALRSRDKSTLELWGHATTRQIYSLALRPCNYATNLLQSSGAMQQSNKFTLELWGNAITMQQVNSKAWGHMSTRQTYSTVEL